MNIDRLLTGKREFAITVTFLFGSLASIWGIPLAFEVLEVKGFWFGLAIAICIYGIGAIFAGLMWEAVARPHIARIKELEQRASIAKYDLGEVKEGLSARSRFLRKATLAFGIPLSILSVIYFFHVYQIRDFGVYVLLLVWIFCGSYGLGWLFWILLERPRIEEEDGR